MDDPPIISIVIFGVTMVAVQRSGLLDKLTTSISSPPVQAAETRVQQRLDLGSLLNLNPTKVPPGGISGFPEPLVLNDCKLVNQGAAGEYNPSTNTITMCPSRLPDPAMYEYALEHERAHAYLFFKGGVKGPYTNELETDKVATDSLIQQGRCATLIAIQNYSTDHPDYVPGQDYRKEQTEKHCLS